MLVIAHHLEMYGKDRAADIRWISQQRTMECWGNLSLNLAYTVYIQLKAVTCHHISEGLTGNSTSNTDMGLWLVSPSDFYSTS